MILRTVVLALFAFTATPLFAQESGADAALRRVQENRAARAADQAERSQALTDRIRADTGRDEGDRGYRTGSSFERQERIEREVGRQIGREALTRQDRIEQLQTVESRLIPQGAPLGSVDPALATGRQVLDLRDPAVAQRWQQAWRADPRFDWRSLRQREPNRFRVSTRVGAVRRSTPGIGDVIASAPTSAWLRDPLVLRLPPLARPYRWIRVGRAAVLLDGRSSRVVDVVDDFFLVDD